MVAAAIFLFLLGSVVQMTDIHAATVVSNTDVVIVGAGVSGLAAASILQQNGASIAIVEARDRIGGRVDTVSLDGVSVDLGAQWLHGEQNLHFLHSAVQSLGATTVRSYFEPSQTIASVSGTAKVYDDAFMNKAYAEWKLVTGLIDNYYQNQGNKDQALYSGIWLAVKKLRSQNKLSILKDDKWVEFMISTEIVSDYGGSADKQSLWWFNNDCCYGKFEDSYVPQGVTRLLQEKFKSVLDPALKLVNLNQVVTLISQNASGCSVTTNQNQVFAGKVCLVTIPLGVLQNSTASPKFNPPLSSAFKAALNMRALGQTSKVILEFDNAFWGTSTLEAFYFLPSTAAGVKSTEFIEFVNADYYFSRLSPKPKSHFMVAFSSSPTLNAASDEQAVAMVMNSLNQMYPGKVPAAPKSYLVKAWGKDPFALGSWSYNKVGINIKTAFTNIAKNGKRVFFAGEHCSSIQYGSMNGAYDSGTKAAKNILKFLGVSVKPFTHYYGDY